MQKYFIKHGSVDNKNPQQEKSQSPQQCSSSMNVDGQDSNPESQSYGHNDDIHLQGNLSPNVSDNNVENVHHNEANVSSSNDHYLSSVFILKVKTRTPLFLRAALTADAFLEISW